MKAYHAVYSTRQTSVKLFEPVVRKMQGRHVRLRVRSHYGFDAENLQTLKQYGMRAADLPVAVAGCYTVDMSMAGSRPDKTRNIPLWAQELQQERILNTTPVKCH